MAEDRGGGQFETKTDVEALAEYARLLELAGLFEQALRVWRDVLEIDGNYLPAWEAASRLLGALSRHDGKDNAR